MVCWKSLLNSDRALNAEQRRLRMGHCEKEERSLSSLRGAQGIVGTK